MMPVAKKQRKMTIILPYVYYTHPIKVEIEGKKGKFFVPYFGFSMNHIFDFYVAKV